jgi:methionyl-tRNA formyltransferase
MISVVFLGGKAIGGQCLEYLIQAAPALNIAIAGVGASPRGDAVRALARAAGIELFESPGELPPCDYILSVQYHAIVRPDILARARRDAINLHLAPLPEYRGCNQFTLAILNGDRQFGVTLHRMDAGVDTGAIIAERRFPIDDDIWVDDLVRRAEEEGAGLFRDSLPLIRSGDYPAIEQSELVAERGTSFCRRDAIEKLKEARFDAPGEAIARLIRASAMPGFAPPFARLGDRIVRFTVEKD